MKKQAIYALLSLMTLCLLSIVPVGKRAIGTDTKQLATHAFSLEKRYPDAFVNRIFKENILLTMAYARHIVDSSKPVNWSTVDAPFRWSYVLNPGRTLVYHDNILPTYRQNAVMFQASHFNSTDGYLSDGYLIGDGTCHLASLIAWVAKDAGLAVDAPTNHDFHPVPEVPRADGVSIFSQPQEDSGSQLQNLYVTNSLSHPVRFEFEYNGTTLTISSVELL